MMWPAATLLRAARSASPPTRGNGSLSSATSVSAYSARSPSASTRPIAAHLAAARRAAGGAACGTCRRARVGGSRGGPHQGWLLPDAACVEGRTFCWQSWTRERWREPHRRLDCCRRHAQVARPPHQRGVGGQHDRVGDADALDLRWRVPTARALSAGRRSRVHFWMRRATPRLPGGWLHTMRNASELTRVAPACLAGPWRQEVVRAVRREPVAHCDKQVAAA